jgi:SAM-dependent methyltransferase
MCQRTCGYARRDLAGLPNVDWVHLNGYNLGNIDAASFDAVYCSAVFMHLDEWERYRYVQDALRIVRPGGRVFFDNYNLLGEAGWRFFEENSRLDIAVRPPNVSRSSTPQELHEYLRRAGFAGIRVEEGDLFVTVLGTRPA